MVVRTPSVRITIVIRRWMAESDALKVSGPFWDRQPSGNEIGMYLINTCFSTRICPRVSEQNRSRFLGQAPQALKLSGQHRP